MDSDPRPYLDQHGALVYLTDEQLKALGPNPPVRRLESGEDVPPPEPDIVDQLRMADDGGLTGVE